MNEKFKCPACGSTDIKHVSPSVSKCEKCNLIFLTRPPLLTPLTKEKKKEREANE